MNLREFLPQNEESFRSNILSSTAINSSTKRKSYHDINSGVVALTEQTQHKIDWSFFKEPTGLLPFNENIKRIDALLGDINPIDYVVNYYVNEEGLTKGYIDAEKFVKNEKGSSLGTLKVLLYGIINDLTVGEVLLLFSEHLRNVLDNPNEVNNHKNIRAIMSFPSDMHIKAVCPELRYASDEQLKEIVLNYKPQN